MRNLLLLLCVAFISAELTAQLPPSAAPPSQSRSKQTTGDNHSKRSLGGGTEQRTDAQQPFVVQSAPTSSALTPVLLTFTATILAALLGILGKYRYDLRIAQRKDRLERINTQLRLLYGPLYASDLAARAVWRAFWYKLNVDIKTPPDQWRELSANELAEWRTWVTEVFMPLNERMEKAIVENADLFETGEIPEGLLKLCAHVAAYKALRANWKVGNYSERSPLIDYPAAEFREYVQTTFKNLRLEQARLLTSVRGA